jgi:hypothetical protein
MFTTNFNLHKVVTLYAEIDLQSINAKTLTLPLCRSGQSKPFLASGHEEISRWYYVPRNPFWNCSFLENNNLFSLSLTTLVCKWQYHSSSSNVNCVQMCTNYYIVAYYFKFYPATVVSDTIFTWKTYILQFRFKVDSEWHLLVKQHTR